MSFLLNRLESLKNGLLNPEVKNEEPSFVPQELKAKNPRKKNH
jgi:hypothetical protein